jgi:hypothetical protein
LEAANMEMEYSFIGVFVALVILCVAANLRERMR